MSAYTLEHDTRMYHGTCTGCTTGITDEGLRDISGEFDGAIYLTPDLDYACLYAVCRDGGDHAGVVVTVAVPAGTLITPTPLTQIESRSELTVGRVPADWIVSIDEVFHDDIAAIEQRWTDELRQRARAVVPALGNNVEPSHITRWQAGHSIGKNTGLCVVCKTVGVMSSVVEGQSCVKESASDTGGGSELVRKVALSSPTKARH